MVSLINVISDIKNDFEKDEYVNVGALSRKFILAKGIAISVSMYKSGYTSEIGVVIPPDITVDMLNSLPKWKGMEERLSTISGPNGCEKHLYFRQLFGYDELIFEKVMQDVLDGLDQTAPDGCLISLKSTLEKWSVFFRFEKENVLSEVAQQGLYGELWFLERMIELNGNKAFGCWTGYNAEAHDFYFGKDAVEIKSSSAKGPEQVIIHSEYQLDDMGIDGLLYLVYLNMKKSSVDGECLPDIVDRIYEKLDIAQKTEFVDNLLKVGYVFSLPHMYSVCFRVREDSYFIVKDDFPRITAGNLSKGIGSVEYTVSLDACRPYIIENEAFYREVDIK